MGDYGWVDEMKNKLASQGMKDADISEAVESLRQIEKGPQPYNVITFARTERPKYVAEVAKKGEDFIYHFWPDKALDFTQFENLMGDAFLEVFKFPERCASEYIPELESFAVKVSGVSANPFIDGLLPEVFKVLDERLGG